MAYGHRKPGDCTDIENVIPVGPVSPGSFSKMVNSLTPRGKTPLTEAVREAADVLNYRDTAATVILVSDGVESCNADPCALAEELERGGVNFTAHVVGFDVGRIKDQGQLSCLAEKTGGLYLTADNADELTTALKTVAAPAPPPPPMLKLEAAESETGQPLSNSGIQWTVVKLDDEQTVLDGESMASPSLEVGGGRFFARAVLGELAGSVEFDYAGDADATQRVVMKLVAQAEMEAAASVVQGANIKVAWTGPDNQNDYITVVPPDADEGKYGPYGYTRNGDPADVRAPDKPGEYELRYSSGKTRKTLGRRPITVIAADITMEAPDQISAGSAIKVTWTGPDNFNDYITIVPADADEGKYTHYKYTRDGSPSDIRAPAEPGAYELRYVSGGQKATFARRPITITDAEVTLEAPETIGAGASIKVTWTGPDNTNDYITVVPVGEKEGKHGAYAYTRNGDPADVRAPDTAGDYELRYMTGQSNKTLARIPISVTDAAVTLEAPETIGAGASIKVTWTGPDNKNDYITVVPVGEKEGKHGAYAYTRKGSPLDVRAPDTAGDYELRYMTGQSNKTLARIPISVTDAAVTLTGPASAITGSNMKIDWTGPNNQNDFITVVPVGEKEGKHGAYAYTRKGSPADVRAPDAPGDYELRYVTGQSRKTLASVPVSITAATATLDAPGEAAAGSNIKIDWTGPDNQNDFITVVPVGEKEGKHGAYTYTRKGSPADVRAPDAPGDYELRYLNGQSRTTLTSVPITVTAVTAELRALGTVKAGHSFPVKWKGPDNKNDYITIVPVDTKEGKHGPYAYTRKGSPATLKAPDTPGAYELRYLMGQSKSTLARLPITVE